MESDSNSSEMGSDEETFDSNGSSTACVSTNQARDSKVVDSDSSSDMSNDSESEGEENGFKEVANDDNEASGVSADSALKVEEDDDEVVKAIIREREKKRMNHPPDISMDNFAFDICFHPHNDLIGVASIDGDITIHKYSTEGNYVVKKLDHHTKSCRDVEFNESGSLLYSAGKDKAIHVIDVETWKPKLDIPKAHSSPIYNLLVVDDNLLASGDDDGTVKLWDLRRKTPIFSLKEMEEFVSSMVTTDIQKFLVCTSGDGCVTAINMRSHRLHVQSEPYDAELTSSGLLRQDTKLVVGSSQGKLYLYNWGEFGYHSDEIPGHKEGINSIIPITEKAVVTASEDGLLRAVHFFPNRFLGIVGQHDYPVERLDISNDGHLIASCSHDQTIKFWNVQYFEDVEVTEKDKVDQKTKTKFLPSSRRRNVSDFFAGMAPENPE